MPQGTYKVLEAIGVTYQAAAATTGLDDVTMEIYDETGAKDIVNFADVLMTEIGATGRYKGSFTPDEEGKWRVMIDSATKPGKLVKDFDVTAANINSIGDAVAAADGKIDTVDGKVDTAQASIDALNDVSSAEVNAAADTALTDYDAPTKAELDITETNIRGADSDTLKSISDQIDGLPGASDAPPMIG